MTPIVIEGSAQEVYDRMAAGLAAQHFMRATSPGGWCCLFRCTDGRSCALGQLLDEDQVLTADYNGAVFVVDRIVNPDAARVASAARWAHDYSRHPIELYVRMRTVAEHHGLRSDALGPVPL